MLTIYTTDALVAEISQVIDAEYRLNELVEVADLLLQKPDPCGYNLIVRPKNGIQQVPDWYNVLPPYLLPEEIEYSPARLLALIYAKLGNYERAFDLLPTDGALRHELEIISCLQHGVPVSAQQLHSDLGSFEEYRFCHNAAILHHYAATEADFDANKTRYFYKEALKAAPNGEFYAFTARQQAIFLTDLGELLPAEHLLLDAIKTALSDDAIMELKATLCGVWMKQLVVPYDPALLENLKQALWEVLQHYQKQGRHTEEALLLIDAAQVANYADSFSEALGYINRAVEMLKQEEMPELLAQAQYRRGVLLYTWAKKDNPQFFRGALDSFSDALKVFNREDAPDVFADIQQYLGVIYAEMPDEPQKRSIWAGLSASAFQQSLQFYQKETYPYEYALVCTNFANAMTKFPEAVHTDNMEKALFYYAEALTIRTADQWPLERAVTLLNYVETCWFLNLANAAADNQSILEDMIAKTEEARRLTTDPAVAEAAQSQLEKLAELRVVLEEEV